jgi:hypothetical protein
MTRLRPLPSRKVIKISKKLDIQKNFQKKKGKRILVCSIRFSVVPS